MPVRNRCSRLGLSLTAAAASRLPPTRRRMVAGSAFDG